MVIVKVAKKNFANGYNKGMMKMEKFRRAKRIGNGHYLYKNYELANLGYHHPDHCIWWEATNLETDCADYHANTKQELMDLIDEGL